MKDKKQRVDERRGVLSKIGDESAWRAVIAKMFGNSGLSLEDAILQMGKWTLFALLAFMEILILAQHVEQVVRGGRVFPFVASVLLAATFTIVETVKIFVMEESARHWAFYAVEVGAASGFFIVTEGAYSLIFAILLLTQFYFNAPTFRAAVRLFFMTLPLCAVSYVLQVYLMRGQANVFEIMRETLATLVALVLHFFAVQVVMSFYRQYKKLNKTLAELAQSKKELERAYARVEEVTLLEERQRIAKEIHDTAGHSLTTVIMQTEAAKRIIDENPSEAKVKIAAANLQARHTLERLRESIHLLSGAKEGMTLKMEMENVIRETSDGTGIRIRSDLADISVTSAKHRFLCNTLKEGIANGLRHGGATAFWLELKQENDKIYFLLSDNGKGLNGGALKYGFGLTSMRTRAESLGGELSIISEPEEGFELQVTLPMDAMN